MLTTATRFPRVRMSLSTVRLNSAAFKEFLVKDLFASPAYPNAFVEMGVLFGELVASYAVRFFGVGSGKRIPAQNVLSVRDRLKVNGIHTMAHTAQVVRDEVRRNSLDEHSVRDVMGSTALIVDPETSIAILVGVTRPQPTRCSVPSDARVDLDLREKSREQFQVYRNAVSIGLSHCVNLLERFAIWSESLGCFRTPSARFILARSTVF